MSCSTYNTYYLITSWKFYFCGFTFHILCMLSCTYFLLDHFSFPLIPYLQVIPMIITGRAWSQFTQPLDHQIKIWYQILSENLYNLFFNILFPNKNDEIVACDIPFCTDTAHECEIEEYLQIIPQGVSDFERKHGRLK